MTIADDIEALVNRKRRLPIWVWAIIALTCAALVYGAVATNTPPSGEPMLVPSTGEITEAPVTDCDKYAASDNDPQRKETGVPLGKINPDLAVPACETAVRQYPNSTRVSLQLGRAYQKANYFTAAVGQYRRAAEQNYAPAQNNLGASYENGRGVPKDDQQAIAWYRKAAEQNYAPAQSNLGVMYQNGQGVRKDEQQAIAWYRKAADQGLALALNNLDEDAEAAVNRNDFATAIRIMRPLADQGNARAQRLLGMMYNAGWGVPKDDAEAVKWFRRAANQGDGDAQASLGAEYRNGTGVPQDYVHAYMWFILAAQTEEPGVNITAQNIGLLAAQRQAYNIDGTRPTELKPWQVSILKGARAFNCPEGPGRDRCVKVYGYLINLDTLAMGMTPTQIAEAQKLASEWKPTTQPRR